MDRPESAILVPNIISIALLLAVGYAWAGFADRSRLRFGTAIVAVGFVLSALTIWLSRPRDEVWPTSVGSVHGLH